VFAHPFFRRLLVIDLATAVTFSLAFELLPIHSVGSLGLTNRIVGVFFLLNTLAVAGLQLPMVRVLAGRRRMSAYQIMHVAYAVGLFAILAAAGATHNERIVLLAVVMVVLGVAETVYGAVRPAIVTELFSPAVMGRAFGVSTSLFNIGMAASRAGGAALLDRSDRAPWIVGGAVCVAAAFASRRLGATIPVASSRNPPAAVSPA
jgi:MFS family permease